MTTAIHIDLDFVACDGKWAGEMGIPFNDHAISKYLYSKGNISFFAGDEYPIVTYQAKLKELISDDEFMQRSLIQSEKGHELEYIILNASNGDRIAGNENKTRCISVLGSGGEHAANFFYYSKRANYQSTYKNNVVGALKYAYYKDPMYTGDPMTIKSWNPKHTIDTSIENNNVAYDYQLSKRLRELDMIYQHRDNSNQDSLPHAAKSSLSVRLAAASSKRTAPLRTSASNTAPKVTVSGAIGFLKAINEF